MRSVKTFTISRRKWLRGVGGSNSYLLTDEGKQCCVGIYLSACGCHVPVGTQSACEISKAPKWLLGDERTGDSPLAFDLYAENDRFGTKPATRERKIAELFAQAGVKVTFKP